MPDRYLRCLAFALAAATCLDSACIQAEDYAGAERKPFHGYENAITLTNGSIRVVVCGEAGGRVLEYSLNGTNALWLSEEEMNWKPGDPPQSSAGRFDVGPELVVPPHKDLWSGNWIAEITGDRQARLTSPEDDATGVQLVREFVLDPVTSRLDCTQTIRNISRLPVEWCHWSRTFAVGHGICVIPLTSPSRFPEHYVMYEEGTLINARPSDPNIRLREDCLEILGPPRRPKLGFDSYAGSMAYYCPNDLLFIKTFKTWPDRVYNEVAGLTLSVWYPDWETVELEPIGPRERLQPAESASFTETWWLVAEKFPENATPDLSRLKEQIQSLDSAKADRNGR